MFPVEKTAREAVTAKHTEQHTKIPVAGVFFYGEDTEVGPFIILKFVECWSTMCHALKTQTDDPHTPQVLNPNISETTLGSLYSKVALCLLQLSRQGFHCIGSLFFDRD